ncbi:MAG: hypothetical protein WDA18_09965 [Candidatus Ratteibacteria bacterium]|jgi:hypothetical protein
MITETKILEQLSAGKITLPPFILEYVGTGRKNRVRYTRPDIFIELSWEKEKIRFAVEIKARSTPKVFQNALNQIKRIDLPKNIFPMLIFPYLGEGQLEQLEKEKVSGIDLCGNGIIVVPEKLLIVRSGAKNRFPTYSPIRNIYQKNSSMATRIFFVKSQFKTVKEIHNNINACNLLVEQWNVKPMSLSTVSKVLSALEEDLIISRVDGIRLLQKDTLLDKLSQNYDVAPKNQKRVRLKVPASGGSLNNLLVRYSTELNLPIVATGKSSVNQYAVMQKDNTLSVYCPRIDRLLERLGGSQTDRFPNLEIVETETEFFYFDSRKKKEFFWASPVQTYLELITGDKRDRETAEQVRDFILRDTEIK